MTRSLPETFRRILIERYHYPTNTVVVNNDGSRHKHDLYVVCDSFLIQMFELKSEINKEHLPATYHGSVYKQDIGNNLMPVPLFIVHFLKDDNFELFEIRHGQICAIESIDNVLNYDECKRRFSVVARNFIKPEIPNNFKFLCYSLSALIFVIAIIYVLFELHIISNGDASFPMTKELLFLICLGLLLIMLPWLYLLPSKIQYLKLLHFEIGMMDSDKKK